MVGLPFCVRVRARVQCRCRPAARGNRHAREVQPWPKKPQPYARTSSSWAQAPPESSRRLACCDGATVGPSPWWRRACPSSGAVARERQPATARDASPAGSPRASREPARSATGSSRSRPRWAATFRSSWGRTSWRTASRAWTTSTWGWAQTRTWRASGIPRASRTSAAAPSRPASSWSTAPSATWGLKRRSRSTRAWSASCWTRA